jgi:hypothetical protein
MFLPTRCLFESAVLYFPICENRGTHLCGAAELLDSRPMSDINGNAGREPSRGSNGYFFGGLIIM